MKLIIDIAILLALVVLSIEAFIRGKEMCIGYLFVTATWLALLIERWTENRKK